MEQPVRATPISDCQEAIFSRELFETQIGVRKEDQDPIFNMLGGVFVAHYSPAAVRKEQLDRRMQAIKMSATVITSFDREALSEQDVECMVNDKLTVELGRALLTKSESSLTIKHFSALQRIVSQNLSHGLLLEDDAVFTEGFKDVFKKATDELPEDYDMLMLGTCWEQEKRGAQFSTHLWLAQAARCTHGILVSQRGARIMLDTLPIRSPMDWQINYAVGMPLHDDEKNTRVRDGPRMTIYWAEPGVILQGWADGAPTSFQERDEASTDPATRASLDAEHRVTTAKATSMGAYLHEKKRYDEAAHHYELAMEAEPTTAQPVSGIGVLFKDMGRAIEAQAMQKRAIHLDPTYTQAYINLGVALAEQRDLDEAIHYFRQAVVLEPTDDTVFMNLGSALQVDEKVDEAIASFESGLAMRPNEARALSGLAISLKSALRHDEARSNCQAAIRINPARAHPICAEWAK
jgi:tetratricopeptide (TPR) repeat protein